MTKRKKNVAPEMANGARMVQKQIIESSRPVGRPNIRTMEIETEIFERLSNGEGLERITQDSHMPHRATVSNWMKQDPEFMKEIMTAYQLNTLFMVEMGMSVIDGSTYSTGNVERDKAKLSYIKWLMGKFNRTVFGEHIQVTERKETVQIVLPSQFDGIDADFSVIDKPETGENSEMSETGNQGPCTIAERQKP